MLQLANGGEQAREPWSLEARQRHMGPIHLHLFFYVCICISISIWCIHTPCRRRPPRSSDAAASPAVAAAATKSPLTTKFKVDFQVAVGWASHQKLRAEREEDHQGGSTTKGGMSHREEGYVLAVRYVLAAAHLTVRYVQTAMYRPLGRFSLPYPHLGFTTQYYVLRKVSVVWAGPPRLALPCSSVWFWS